MIQYHTRSGVVSSEKIKVYITGHPDDRDTYIQQAINLMLNLYNCAVCTADGTVMQSDELEALCFEIKLAVVVVSRKYLEEPNNFREDELLILNNSNVKIMPLVMEENLGTLFREKMGHIQYLNGTSNDKTARSLTEKVKDFLDPILGTAEDYKQYKNAYSLSGFISYRKKDRAVLLDLMKIIRNDARCDVLGFWYDEMLTLGEHYGEEIEEAIDDSNLFILLITPNLLEPDNYVWKYEYKHAIETGKSIWPIMLNPMSSEEIVLLKEMYPGLPDIITRDDIADRFGRLGVDYNHDDHITDKNKYGSAMYIRGMAYLNGILTTFDSHRGVMYLKKSAKAGFIEAYKQLFGIYYNGYPGIPPRLDKAIFWQNSLLEYLKELENNNSSEEILLEIFEASVQLADIFKTCGKLNEALNEYIYIINRAENMKLEDRVFYAEPLLVAYTTAALILRANGDNKNADLLLSRNDELNRAAFGDSDEVIDKDRNWFVTSIQRMDAYFHDKAELVEDAAAVYSECLDWAKEQCKLNPTSEALSDLASAYERVGDVYRVIGKNSDPFQHDDRAVEFYLTAYEYGKKARAEDNTMAITINQLNRARRIADEYFKLGYQNYKEARTFYNKVSNGFNIVVQSLGVKQAVFNMPYIMDAYNNLYLIDLSLGLNEEAKICKQNYENIIAQMQNT